MANINEQLALMVNKVVDSVYLVVMENKIGWENFCKIIDRIEDYAFDDIYKHMAHGHIIRKNFQIL